MSGFCTIGLCLSIRLIFTAFYAWISNGYFPSSFTISKLSELANLFIFYGLGFAAISFIMCYLYFHAFKMKKELKLTMFEILYTKIDISIWFELGIVAILSSLFAFLMPVNIAVYAGFVYFLSAIISPIISNHYHRKI